MKILMEMLLGFVSIAALAFMTTEVDNLALFTISRVAAMAVIVLCAWICNRWERREQEDESKRKEELVSLPTQERQER